MSWRRRMDEVKGHEGSLFEEAKGWKRMVHS